MTIVTKRQRAVALWALLLGLLASQVAQGQLHAFDRDVAQIVAAWRSSAWDPAVGGGAFFGSSAWTMLALAACVALAWRQQRRHAAWILVWAYALGMGLEIVLRLWVMQWRPGTAMVSGSAGLIERFHLAGFPSGHAFRSAFLFGWIIKELQARRDWWARAAQAGCALIILLVGAGRLYLNRHWASDVMGGWLVALLALAVAVNWEQAFERQSTVSRP